MAQTPASRWVEAITEAVWEGDVPTAVNAARDLWSRYVVSDAAAVRSAVEALPDPVWQNDPWLLTAMACAHFFSPTSIEHASAPIYLREAERLLAEQDDPDLDVVLAMELCSVAYTRTTGHFVEASEQLDRVEERLAESPRTSLEVRMALEARIRLERSQLDWHQGRLDHGLDHVAPVLALEQHLWEHECAVAFGVAALYAVTSEHYDKVDEWATRAAAVADAGQGATSLWETPAMAPALAALGLAALERGDLESASEAARRLERAAGTGEWSAYRSQIETTLLVLEGRMDEALESVRATRALMHGWTGALLLESFATTVRTGVEIALGLTHERDLPVVDLPGDSRHAMCPGQFNGWLFLSEGRYDDAIASVADCIRLGDAHSRASLIDVLLIDAAAHYAIGDVLRGSSSVDYALRLCAESGFRRAFFHLPPALLRPMLQNAAAHPQPDSVRALIAELESRFDTTSDPAPQLSAREVEIVAALARGLSQREVATYLYISHNTLKTHVRNIYRKLGVSSQAEALAAAAHLGLTPHSPSF